MNVLLGCPTHDGRIDFRTSMQIHENASHEHSILVTVHQSSLLANNCNKLWCDALNKRSKLKLEWFAMCHSDIAPDHLWLDQLIKIANDHNADILSVVSPIKNHEGLTSTAIWRPGMDARRITMTELKKLPPVFGLGDVAKHFLLPAGSQLVVNTGCMVVRLNRSWNEHTWFNIVDAIIKRDGLYVPTCEPEDWYFSRKATLAGAKVMATTAVKLNHFGTMPFSNQEVWGKETDV